MQPTRTPDTSKRSDLERRDRNDNTSTANAYPEKPDTQTGNEFEVPRRNEVHPEQQGGSGLTENQGSDNENNKGNEGTQQGGQGGTNSGTSQNQEVTD